MTFCSKFSLFRMQKERFYCKANTASCPICRSLPVEGSFTFNFILGWIGRSYYLHVAMV